MAEEQNEALLKLKILNGEDLKDIRFLGKFKSFTLVWLNPRFKHSSKTLTSSTTHPTFNHNFSFPLSLQALQNPNSLINIQIISPSPIHHERVIGSTTMSVSDIRFNEQVYTLQLWRPSGRAQGLIRVSAKVEINLGFYNTCVTGIPIQSPPLIELEYQHHNVIPSAPLEDQLIELETVNEPVVLVSSCADDTDTDSVQLATTTVVNQGSDKVETHTTSVTSCNPSTSPTKDGSNALRSLLVGFLGGVIAVATVLVGSSHD